MTLGALDVGREAVGNGRPKRYMANARGRAVVDIDPPTPDPPAERAFQELNSERLSLMRAIDRLGEHATRLALAPEVGANNTQSVKARCITLIRMGLVVEERDPTSSRRLRYRLTEDGRAALRT